MPRITGSALQGGADAYVEASINTALTGQTRQGYNVTRITFEGANWAFGGSGVFEYEVALSRRSKAAMPDIDDPDVILKWAPAFRLSTSGGFQGDKIIEFLPPDRSMIIVEDPIYLELDSNNTAGANNVIAVIEFEVITLSEVDRLSILVNSLT